MYVQGKSKDIMLNNFEDVNDDTTSLDIPVLQKLKKVDLRNFQEIRNNTTALKTHFKPEIIVSYVVAGMLATFLLISLFIGLISAVIVYIRRPKEYDADSPPNQVEDPDSQPFFSQDPINDDEGDIPLEDSLNVSEEISQRNVPAYKPPSIDPLLSGVGEIPDDE
eukprot:gene4246-7583_t